MPEPLRVDVWSDLVCPFCYVGKHRLEEAARQAGVELEVTYRAFELDPAHPGARPLLEHLRRKFGSAEATRAAWAQVAAMGTKHGLRFDWERAIASPTFDAHRVVLHAQAQGLGSAAVERLMRAHFAEGLDLSDRATLARLAAEAGVADAGAMLPTDAFAHEVRADEAAARAVGIRGVPFFVLDGRLALSGAQPVEAFVEAFGMARAPPA